MLGRWMTEGRLFSIDVLVFALAWLSSSVIVVVTAVNNPSFGADTAGLILPTHNWLAGDGFAKWGEVVETHLPPGVGILAYPFYLLSGSIEYSGSILSVTSYVLLIPLIYFASRRCLGRFAGGVASLFVAATPALWFRAIVPLSECVFTLFLIGVFFLAIEYFEKGRLSPTLSALLGFLLGFGTLIRPEMFFVAVLGGVLIAGRSLSAVRQPIGDERLDWSMVISPLIIVLIFLAVLTPYVFFLYEHLGYVTFTGKFGPVTGWMERHGGYQPTGADQGKGALALLKLLIGENPSLFIKSIIHNIKELILMVYKYLNPVIYLCLISIFVSIWFSRRRFLSDKGNRKMVLAVGASALMCGAPVAPLLFLFVETRVFVPYLVLAAVVLGWSATALLNKYKNDMVKEIRWGAVYAFCGLLIVIGTYADFIDFARYQSVHRGLRAAGIWLRENVDGVSAGHVMVAGKGTPITLQIMGRKAPRGRRTTNYRRHMNLSDFPSIMRARGARYFVLSGPHMKKFPQLQTLWQNPGGAPGYGFRLVFAPQDGMFKIFDLVSGGNGAVRQERGGG
jgi:4-amino-4-deoxy-L-arabinose transferase-like glycosyltransferase